MRFMLMTPGLISSQRSVTVMPRTFSHEFHQRVNVFSCCSSCFWRRSNITDEYRVIYSAPWWCGFPSRTTLNRLFQRN